MEDQGEYKQENKSIIYKVMQPVNDVMDIIFGWLNKGTIIRRVALGIAFYMQYTVIEWSMWYASHIPEGVSALDAAAIIAAVVAPSSTLLGAAIKFYNDARK